VCANGSQYKYFNNFSETSKNVVIFLEGGGACTNYESCAGGRPFNTDCIKEPAGADCIRDDYPAVYYWLMRTPAPMRVFSNLADAEAWLLSLDNELFASAKAG